MNFLDKSLLVVYSRWGMISAIFFLLFFFSFWGIIESFMEFMDIICRVDTIQKLREKIPSLRAELKDERTCFELYKYGERSLEQLVGELSLTTVVQVRFAPGVWV